MKEAPRIFWCYRADYNYVKIDKTEYKVSKIALLATERWASVAVRPWAIISE